MCRRAPDLHVGAVRFVIPRQWILGLTAAAAAPAILLSLPHGLCSPDKRLLPHPFSAGPSLERLIVRNAGLLSSHPTSRVFAALLLSQFSGATRPRILRACARQPQSDGRLSCS